MQQVTTDKLIQDLRTVVADAEELLKATAGQTGERIEKVRGRAEQSVREADGRVRDNAWTAVGIAAGVGLVAGLLLARK
jgi:ElaB/YqjD/DUF883 family membrane-anchored ribosome-binding protein